MRIIERSGLTGTYWAIAINVVVFFASTNAMADSVATINGVEIDKATFDFYLQNRAQTPLAQVTAEEREMALQELKDIYILATQPRATELAKDPKIKAQIELQYRAAIAQAVATDWLARNPATDEEMQAQYDVQALLAPQLQFKARHILVETQAAALDLVTQLDDGVNFEELAKTHSTGPSGTTGGDLGWFSPNQMVAAFSDAVGTLEDGAYTQAPVQTQFGWHVILREESRTSEAPPLDSVRDTVKQSVEQSKFQQHLEALRLSDVE